MINDNTVVSYGVNENVVHICFSEGHIYPTIRAYPKELCSMCNPNIRGINLNKKEVAKLLNEIIADPEYKDKLLLIKLD